MKGVIFNTSPIRPFIKKKRNFSAVNSTFPLFLWEESLESKLLTNSRSNISLILLLRISYAAYERKKT